jgi:capsular polysaccharide transport system permease protein
MALPFDFAPVVVAFGALTLLGLGWGMINLVVSEFFWPWAYFTPSLNRSLILFSGIFYIPDFLPEGARYILSFNPLVHAITLFRMGFYPNYPDLILDLNYLTAWVVGSLVVGFMLERVSRRYVTQ